MARNWKGGLFSVLVVQVSVGGCGCGRMCPRDGSSSRRQEGLAIYDNQREEGAIQLREMNFLVRKVLQLIVRSGRPFLKSDPKFPP